MFLLFSSPSVCGLLLKNSDYFLIIIIILKGIYFDILKINLINEKNYEFDSY